MRCAVTHCGAMILLAAAVTCARAAGPAFSPTCDPAESALVTRIEVPIATESRETRSAAIPAGQTILVVVDERGIDVRVEGRVGGAQLPATDNPMRRWGPQRVLLGPTTATRIELSLIRKEGIRGDAQARIYAFDEAAANERCIRVLRAFSRGDGRYANAQAIALGAVTAAPGSLQREYRAAVQEYSTAAKLLGGDSSLVAAQAELSLATTLLHGLQSYSDALEASRLAERDFAALRHDYGLDRARFITAASEIEIALAVPGRRTPQTEARIRATGLLQHAEKVFREVAENHARRHEAFEQALALNNIGLAHYYADEFEEAVQAYLPALDLYENLGERVRHAQVMQNIALCHHELARFRESREEYARALEMFDQKENPKLYADILNNLAFTEYKSGYPDAALKHHSQALAILERVQSPREQARSLHGIGMTYYLIGNKTEAIEYFERALDLRPEVEDTKRNIPADPTGRIASLRAAADGMRDQKRWGEALELRQEALRISQTPVLDARILVEVAHDAVESGAYPLAHKTFDAIFVNDAGDDPVAYGRALLERARLRFMEQDLASAGRDVGEALALFRARQLTNLVFDAYLLDARINCARGQREQAMTAVGNAIGIAESLRRASSNPTLRTSLWQPVRPAFDLKLQMLVRPEACGGKNGTADVVAALDLAEMSRSRALEDFHELARIRSASPTAAAEARRRELYEVVASRRVQIESLLERVPDNDPRLESLRAEISKALLEIDLLGSEIAGPLQRKRTNKLAVRTSAEMIRRDTAVVEYWLGETNGYAWLITKGNIQMVELGPTSRIDSAARRLLEAMRDLTSVSAEERVKRALDLYALIIRPLPKSLLQASTVYFVPDGALHAVPFAALADGDARNPAFLVDRQDIGVAPTVDAVTGKSEIHLDEKSPVLIVADPVYSRSDSRFNARVSATAVRSPTLRGRRATSGSTTGDWERLPASGSEAAAIVAEFAPGAAESLSGFAANRDAVLQRNLSKYRVVHFATHAVADLEAPQLSALILSMIDAEGRPVAGEIFAGDLLSRPLSAELVVLSACDTALGRTSAGEGLLGMRYAAHASGARAVVASLWPVVDEVGVQVMSGLYDGMIRGRQTPVAALSSAMRDARDRWRDPAMWAVFEASRANPARTIH